MSANLHVRDVPDEVHARLTERARQRGLSLRAYVLSALGRLWRAKALDDDQVREILEELERAPILRLDVTSLLLVAWNLRHRVALRAALYVALARQSGGTLLTADGRLSRVQGLGIEVELIGA